jgi:ribosomal protein S18 acetylase RimI-like enzyme
MISIAKAELSDLNLLREIAVGTFSESFSDQNSEEDMQLYLDQNLSMDKLEREMSDTFSVFYLGYYNAVAVAYLKLNFDKSQTETHKADSLEIERIYVLKEYKGRGIGKQLLGKAIEIAEGTKLKNICLGVWEKNTEAIAFYRKHGFREIGQHVFMLGNDAQNDQLMQLDLP